jgi:Fic family protein
MAHKALPDAVLAFVLARITDPAGPPSAGEITSALGASRPTINRLLAKMVADGRLERTARGPATRYHPGRLGTTPPAAASPEALRTTGGAAANALRESLARALGVRTPVSYERAFVDDYVPNETSLLPVALAASLYKDGRAQGQQPAGTVARKVLEQLLIDLSWQSSRLEGNRKSLLDTRELFASGGGDGRDPDVTMLLNHKAAIEFMVDAVPQQGITVPVVRNLHALLMQGLLDDTNATGAIRRRIVTIEGSVYQPTHVPLVLEEMLNEIVGKARLIRNPIEGAFFLWVNVAYLQPFEDGNKRTSRLSANLPLLIYNCAPLSFLEVEVSEYAYAMLGVYEQRNVALAVDLFEATYRRSIAKYHAALSAFGTPDPVRVRYREELRDVVRRVVGGESLAGATQALGLDGDELAKFTRLAHEELTHLQIYNCARYRLSIPITERWIAAGRPGL